MHAKKKTTGVPLPLTETTLSGDQPGIETGACLPMYSWRETTIDYTYTLGGF
jgi:hypothetical protein